MKKISLLISDVIVLFLSLVLMLFARYTENFSYQFRLHLIPFLIIFVLWLIVFYIQNLYETTNLKNNSSFYSSLFLSILTSAIISTAFFYLIPPYGITPKTNLLIFVLLFTILEFLNRSLVNSVLQKRFKKSIIITGLNEQSLELAKFLKDNPQLGYTVKYIADLTPESFDKTENEFGKFGIIQGVKNLEEAIKNESINVVVISPEAYQIPKIINVFYKSLEQKISFYNLSSFYEKVTGKIPLGTISQIWFLENLTESKKNVYEKFKRFTDIILSVVFGGISLLLYPPIILAIKASSSGPIFIRQKRVGQNGGTFTLYKFRSMIANSPDGSAEGKSGPVWTSTDDKRITKLGKFLRKTRIDELPQLWNILRGEMSFVGPRAERPEFHGNLQEKIPFYEERYLIKPGLTGWAQINFRYGASFEDTAEKLKYDLYYIKNRSPMLDLGIILKTIRISLKQAGR